MKANIKKKPVMAVIRGVRPSEALFYDKFKNIKIKFIYFSQEKCAYPVKTKNLDFVNLTLKPKYFIEPFSLLNGGRYTNRSLVEINGLEEEIKGVDVVNICDTFYPWAKQAVDNAKKYNKKIVTIIWETIHNHPTCRIPPFSSCVKSVIEKTDLFILRSNAALRFMETFDIPRKKIKVIYKGVDTNRFRPSKTKLKSRSAVRILYVGQLTKSKGIDDLLQAFVLLTKKIPKVELALAGKGILTGRIDKLSKKYPIKNLGFVDYESLPNIYRQADIYCSPSKDLKYFKIKVWEELFSYTLMEAQASGLPIVASRCGGIPEEIGKANFLVDQGDVEGLYRALVRLVENKDLCKRTGLLNRERALKYFSLGKQAKKTEEAILSVLN